MKKLPEKLFFLLAIAGLLVWNSGCITRGEVKTRVKAVEDLTGKEHDPMYNCTPVALAKAEAYADFANHESEVGDSLSAKEYLLLAEKYARLAYRNSRDRACLSDTDLDTIPDIEDQCPKTPGVKENHGCPIPDRDGDGIPDKKDRCPTKPGPAINHGCPIIDTDGDGIPDHKDKCPKEPGPPINHGCPFKDTDKDGIPDDQDKCPTKPGPVENNGCPYKLIKITDNMIVLKQKIFFAFNKAKIKERSYPILNEIAQALKDHPKWKIEIQGHTDDRGSARYNQKLSEKRAFAVYKFLISKGIEPDRMTYIGYGEERPIEDNATEEGRAVNRRVEFHIVNK
jgi:outer membrane protein OmpA-like peptidoglycan-associated protein